MNPDDLNSDDLSAALGGRYAFSRLIGDGTQGVVFAAMRQQARDGSPADDQVALKVYLDNAEDERVKREIAAMERIRHPTLADLIEHGLVEVGGEVLRYCAWEYIRGKPLDKRLREGPLSSRAVAVVGRDVALAISEIWKQTIVHRDISPKNVMVRTGEREAVLIDLGVARHLGRTSLTAYGFSWGTSGYLSPAGQVTRPPHPPLVRAQPRRLVVELGMVSRVLQPQGSYFGTPPGRCPATTSPAPAPDLALCKTPRRSAPSPGTSHPPGAL